MKTKRPTIICIKDDEATNESAQSIINNICRPFVAARADINLTQLVILINNVTELTDYGDYSAELKDTNVTLVTRTTDDKLTFAEFHNFTVDVSNDFCTDEKPHLHILSGALKISTKPDDVKAGFDTLVGNFISDLFDMLTLLKRPVWFNTASDAANYAYGHYFTTADIINVDGKVTHFEAPKCFMWAGNSNLDWIYVNTAMPTTVDLHFTNYTYDFLAVKELIVKSTKTDGYYANMFPTVPLEVGSHYRLPAFDRDRQQFDFASPVYEKELNQFKSATDELVNKPTTINTVTEYMKSVLPAAKPV